MGAEERKQMEEMTYTAMMLQQDLLVKIGERTAKTLQEQLGLPSMTQLKGHIATTGELSNDMKAQMAHTLTDSLKLKKAAAEALDLNFFPRRADAPTGEHSVTTTTKPARATLQQLVKNGARRKDTTAHTATIADTSLSSLRPRRKTGTREQDEARGREIGAGDEPTLRIVDNRIVDEGGATTSKSTSGGRAAAEHQTRVRSIKSFAQPFEGGIQVYFILAGFEMDATESEDMDGVDGANEGGGESHAAANDGPSAVRPQTRGDAHINASKLSLGSTTFQAMYLLLPIAVTKYIYIDSVAGENPLISLSRQLDTRLSSSACDAAYFLPHSNYT